MARFAGQMQPTGTEGTEGKTWVPCDGSYVPAWRFPHYFAATTWLVGMTGIHRSRVPTVAGWSVLMVDDPEAPDLPPDTPTAANPPTAPAAYVGIDAIGDQEAGPVPVAGDIAPSTAVEAAPLIGGVPGGFVAMTTSGERWSGSVTMAAGVGVAVRVQVAGQSFNHHDSAPFNVT